MLCGLRKPRDRPAQRGVDRQHAGHGPGRHLRVVEILLACNDGTDETQTLISSALVEIGFFVVDSRLKEPIMQTLG